MIFKKRWINLEQEAQFNSWKKKNKTKQRI